MVEEFLRVNPYLKPVNLYNLFNRFLECSNNTMVFVFNIFKKQYELHSIKSWRLNGESLNAVIEDELINGWIIIDYLANNITKFGQEVASEREVANSYIELQDGKGLELLTTRALKTIETMVGREI